MSLSQTSVAKLYAGVIEEVIGGVREFFMDEGVDEQVLMELKHTWETKLQATKAVEVKQDEPQPPPLKNIPKPNNPIHLQQSSGQQSGLPLEISTKNVSIQITLPPQNSVPDAQPRSITIQVPATALQGNQLQSVLTGPVISATMALPQQLATALLQQHVTAALQGHAAGVIQMHQTNNGIPNTTADTTNRQTFPQQPTGGVSQLDGHHDSSDDDEEEEEDEEEVEEEDDADDDEKEDEENDENDGGAEEEPLNSGDDVSEEDPSELFETDNVVVCQYDKITRSRNKWKFYLKDGIMNLGGKDYVFQKSNGDAEW